jgi:hypothetical protein
MISLAPTTFENVFHVGYLVPDLRDAMETIGRQLEISWATPFEMESGFETAAGEPDSDLVRIAFSSQGPPYLELIEVVPRPGSIFAEPSPSEANVAGGGFHHFGIYAERWRDEVGRLTDEGMVLERTGAGVAFVRNPVLGVRVEVVSYKGRDFLRRILSGEMGADHPLADRA